MTNGKEFSNVFVFNISKGLENANMNMYEATRKYWAIGEWRNSADMYAVGLVNGFAECAFKIENWESTDNENDIFGKPALGKFKFNGKPITDSELLNKNWKKIITQAKGYWGFGGWLVVSFDKDGNYRIKKGASDKDWHKC